jgi:hypothetical protein
MKKVLLTLLAMILVIGVLAGAGFAGYRVGYDQGARASGNDNTPLMGRPENPGRDRMPMFNFGRDSDHRFDRGPDHGFPRGDFRIMPHGRGFGMFSPFMFLAHIAIWVLVIGLVYLLFTRSGLRLSLTKQPVQDPPANIETGVKPQDQNSENE